MPDHTLQSVLLLAEGSTLAHVGRPLLVARLLHNHGIRVTLARPPAYSWMTRDEPFTVVNLHTQPPAEFARRLDAGRPLYDLDTLEAYVTADRALLSGLRPDVVVGDFRLSLSVSARLEGIPYATLCDAYWSPEAPLEPALPVFPWTRFAPIQLAQAVFQRVAPLAFRIHARPMERLRRRHGLGSLGHDLRLCYTDADLRLFANPRALFPKVHEHAGAAFIGPLAWSPAGEGELTALKQDGRPLVYVTMGSSGSPAVLAALLPVLERFDCDIVLTTAGKPLPMGLDTGRARIFDYLPGDRVCAQASLVICNGGSPTTNQALSHGVPVLGIARNMDQFLNMRAIEDFGAGLLMRADRVSPVLAATTLRALLTHPGFTQRARDLRDTEQGITAGTADSLVGHLTSLTGATG
ncbi:glycosyltransferase [Thauera mechernichensis]